MNDNTATPLHVYQVLEEEYVSLYGQIPGEPLLVELPVERGDDEGSAPRTRVVAAALDWGFRLGHVKSPVGLAADLLLDGGGPRDESALREVSGTRDETARAKLREYVTASIERPTLDALARWTPPHGGPHDPPDALTEPLRRALNRLLNDPGLYDPERFSKNWLSGGSRGLANMREAGVVFKGDEQAGADGEPDCGTPLAHFNRLLLEDAFPDYFEKSQDIRLAAIHQRLHEAAPSALSLSGGGIRSGTFALGLVQGLARHNLLEKFDYLSTVSGGGYMGGWLTAWLHRHRDGMRGVTNDLKNSDPVSKIDPDAPPLRHLRQYSNFITPKVGFLTADTWAFGGIYLRNLLLNWLVFVPLLLGVLMLPRLVLTFTTWQRVSDAKTVARAATDAGLSDGRVRELDEELARAGVPPEKRVVYSPIHISGAGEVFDVPGLNMLFGTDRDRRLYARHLLLLAGFLLGVWALGYIGFNRPSERGALMDRSKKWRNRTDQKNFLKFCLTPLVLSAFLLTTYWAWSQEGATSSKNVLAFLVFGLLFTFCGWVIASVVLRRFTQSDEAGWKGALKTLVWILVSGVVGGLLFWVISLFELGGSPIVGYGVELKNGEIARLPFAWTDWTKWSWSDWMTEVYVCLGVPFFLLVFWAATTFFVGVSSYSRRVGDEDREWWARFGAWLLIAALAWAVGFGVVIFGPLALLSSPKLLGTVGGLSGLIAVLVARSAGTPARQGAADDKDKSKTGAAVTGLLGSSLTLLGLVFLAAFLSLLSLLTTGITRKIATLTAEARAGLIAPAPPAPSAPAQVGLAAPAQAAPATRPWYESAARWTVNNVADEMTNVEDDGEGNGFDAYVRYITPVVPTVVRPAPTPQRDAPPALPVRTTGPAGDDEGWRLEEADSYTGAKIVHLNVLHHTALFFNLFLFGAFLLLGYRLSRRINLNVFSLHGGYRDRLIRGFLGGSRPPGERDTNPFTGFDPADDIHMHELRWALLDEADLRDARALAAGLRRPEATQAGAAARRDDEPKNPLTDYLHDEKLLTELYALTNIELSPNLKRALRTDLNRVLETRKLYLKFGAEFLKSPRAERVRRLIIEELERRTEKSWAGVPLEDVPLRSEYGILLNRLVLEEAYPGMFKPGLPPPYKMLHVVNTTLNLVGGGNLAWQQRKAEPFSVSPLHSGCFRVGYRPSRDFGGDSGISLGTAVAVSGAAASSNMGYYTTSPVISLLLTLFNVRLGWWLGNPGTAGRLTYGRDAPENSVTPVVAEAFGLTDDEHPYVYLTDGGHFENLALYEMVLRRCHIILCSDAAEDGQYRFGDLGNAVRKIRIDLGVSIDFPCVEIYDPAARREEGKGDGPGMYWAIGRIRYGDVDTVRPRQAPADRPGAARKAPDGLLLYIKPAVYGADEPRDVLEYKKSFPEFPHQSTGDQFFDEPQFESYRMLGSFIMDQICGAGFDHLELREVVGGAFTRLYAFCRDSQNPLDEKFVRWLSDLSGYEVVNGEVVPPASPPASPPAR